MVAITYAVGDKFYIVFTGTADVYFKPDGSNAAQRYVSLSTAASPAAQYRQETASAQRQSLGNLMKTVFPGDSFGEVALRQVRTRMHMG